MSPAFGSLFAGVGGFDLGFEAAGWECRWQVEWDARCRSVLARHWPDVARYGDVCDVRDPEPVDCIVFGFPCQDLSNAGKRAGLDGDRSGLFFEATRIIRDMLEATDGHYPAVACAENVPGILTADSGAAMGRVLDELADLGAVDIEWAMLDAQYFGVPQRRRRVFVVAGFGSRGLGVAPLLPVHEGCHGNPASSRPACGATRSVTPGTEPDSGVVAKVLAFSHTQGLDPQVSDSVWPTLRREGGGHAVGYDAGVRRLTPRECERLMGWPDDHTRWDADGTQLPDSFRYRACGNGVAAPVAEWVARQILDAL